MTDSLHDRLAELMKSTDFRTAPAPRVQPQPTPSRPMSTSCPRPKIECRRCDSTGWERVTGSDGVSRVRRCDHRVVHVTPPPANVVPMRPREQPVRTSPRCEHKWSIANGQRSCWLCGADGGRVEGAEPPDLNALMSEAQQKAVALHHRLGPWKKRPNDQYGRRNAWCQMCNKLVVVSSECAPGLPLVYGEALLRKCGE